MKKRSFSEPGCMGCDAHLNLGLSRYCAGFKNKKRRKAFRKSDPAYKAPKWCPKRKNPHEYRVYSYADAESEVMERLMADEAHDTKDIAFPMAHHYRLRTAGTTLLSPAQFFERANDSEATELLAGVNIAPGDVVEIDTGLAQFFFVCDRPHGFRIAFFDARYISAS